MVRRAVRMGSIVVKTWLVLLLVGLMGLMAVGCFQEPAAVPPNETGVLVIKGEDVAEEALLTLPELKAMTDGLVEDDYFALNSIGTKGYTHFKGVWIWHVLKNSVVLNDDASAVSFIAEDGYKVKFTLDEVKKDDYIDEQNPAKKYKMILAWEVDGKELNADEGNPLQLAVGQKMPGDVNKTCWVRNLKTIVID